MTDKIYDVFGIENALIDIILPIDEQAFSSLRLRKGKMHVVKKEAQQLLFKLMKRQNLELIPAGSGTNTIMALANFGMKVGFCGRVGSDEAGVYFEKQLKHECAKVHILRDSIEPTGTVISLVTPDAERTFAVYLGAALDLKKIDVPVSDIAQSKFLYCTAYTLEGDTCRTILRAIEIIKQTGGLFALDLADSQLVTRIHPRLVDIVKKHVDVLFVTEFEALAFTKTPTIDIAIESLAKLPFIVCVKLGEKGSVILHQGKKYNIPCNYCIPIDRTGAGDLYSAGFLYGYLKGAPLQACGELGAYAASKIVQQKGARLLTSMKQEMEQQFETYCAVSR